MSALMQSPDGGQMNVPDARVAAFEAQGWKVISRSAEPAPVAVETPAVESVPEPKAEKPARKGKP